MTRVGIVGIGFMGMVHYLSYMKIPGVEVVAICDRNEQRLAGDWTGIQGNFGPRGGQMDLSGVATFSRFDDLLSETDLDLVDVCLPPSAHADAAVAALESGRHTFCEKPMALSHAECQRMGAAADAAERRLLIGHVLPFFPEYAWALREVRSGEHGRLLGGSFRRVISDPAWLANFWDPQKVGGPLLDLHVHDAHFVRLLFGEPKSITTRGAERNGLPEHWHSLVEFTGGVAVHLESGVISQPGRPFLHGFEIRLEKATLAFEFSVDGDHASYHLPPTIYREAGGAERIDLGDSDPMRAFEAELSHVVDVIASGADPGPLGCQLAQDAIHLCQQQARSLAESLS